MSGLVVALETSSREASIAARSGARTLELRLEAGRAHASDLLPSLDRLVSELGATPRGTSVVLVGTGPGSYTGLRVGVATALGIALGCGAVVRGVPSGETLCFGELEPGEEAAVLLDARAGELYFAHYRRTEDEVVALREPCVLRPEEVEGVLPGAGPVFGDRSAFEASGIAASAGSRLREGIAPRAVALLQLGASRVERLGAQSPRELQPLYLRPFAVRARRR